MLRIVLFPLLLLVLLFNTSANGVNMPYDNHGDCYFDAEGVGIVTTNRTFESGSFSKRSQKRVVLRKNIINGVNVLSQEMLSRYGENTRFIIKYDYILSEDITIPDNCVLKFKGGSIRNGKVDFNGCGIKSSKKVFYNIRFTHLKDFNIKWFDIPDDATLFLQDIVNSCKKVDLNNAILSIQSVIEINGEEGEFYLTNGTITALDGYDVYKGEAITPKGSLFYIHNVRKGAISNLVLNGSTFAQKGLFIKECYNLTIDDCSIQNFDGKDQSMSWGIRCGKCANINIINSHINNIIALPIGKNGGTIGSAAGIVFEHTYDSSIAYNTVENIQSTRDGDAVHIIKLSGGRLARDLNDDVNVIISHNTIKGNVDSKRCIKIQANGIKIQNNNIQKLFMNKTNAVSIYGSNVIMTDNFIDSKESYTIGIGDNSTATLHNIQIRNNRINHYTERDWGACIYMIGSVMNNVVIDSNTVDISNPLNMFCDLRSGLNTFVVSNNFVIGGSHFFHIKNEINHSSIVNLQLKNNDFKGQFDLLSIEKINGISTSYDSIDVFGNKFEGGEKSFKMIDIKNIPEIKDRVRTGSNQSNKSLDF